jgi:hypothetical protein
LFYALPFLWAMLDLLLGRGAGKSMHAHVLEREKLRPKRLSSHHKGQKLFVQIRNIHKCWRSAWQTQQKQSWSIHKKRRWYMRALPQAIIIPLFCMWSIQCFMLAGGKVLCHLPIE